MMRQRARYSSSVHERERLERFRFVHGSGYRRLGSSNVKDGAVVVGELRASRAMFGLKQKQSVKERQRERGVLNI